MKQQEHLRNVPEYIIPETLRSMTGGGGRKKKKNHPQISDVQKKFNKRKADPLDFGVKRKKWFFIFREKMEVVEKHLVEQFDMFSLGKDLLQGNFEETQVIHLDWSFSYSGIVNVLKGYLKKIYKK